MTPDLAPYLPFLQPVLEVIPASIFRGVPPSQFAASISPRVRQELSKYTPDELAKAVQEMVNDPHVRTPKGVQWIRNVATAMRGTK